jgi:hypothetical protein
VAVTACAAKAAMALKNATPIAAALATGPAAKRRT